MYIGYLVMWELILLSLFISMWVILPIFALVSVSRVTYLLMKLRQDYCNDTGNT